MSAPLSKRTRRVVLLAYAQMNLLDLAGPLQALATASKRFSGKGPALYETIVASVDGGPIETSAGLPITTVPLSALEGIAIDTLIAPGGSKDEAFHAPPELVAWIARRGAERIGGRQQNRSILRLQPARQLGDAGRLAGTIRTHDQHNAQLVGFQ